MIVFGLLSSVSSILTFITLRLGFHASATLFAATGSSNWPSPNSPSRSSCAPTGPSATQAKDRARTGRSEPLTAQRTHPRTAPQNRPYSSYAASYVTLCIPPSSRAVENIRYVRLCGWPGWLPTARPNEHSVAMAGRASVRDRSSGRWRFARAPIAEPARTGILAVTPKVGRSGLAVRHGHIRARAPRLPAEVRKGPSGRFGSHAPRLSRSVWYADAAARPVRRYLARC
jgi:hypothetical protein